MCNQYNLEGNLTQESIDNLVNQSKSFVGYNQPIGPIVGLCPTCGKCPTCGQYRQPQSYITCSSGINCT